jgi:NTP pyrophosphatase (non-canonical NTP hydrolase)
MTPQEITARIAILAKLRGFDNATLTDRRMKFNEEARELITALIYGTPEDKRDECADVMVVVWSILEKLGYDPLQSMADKLDRKIAEAGN